jgi:preprotein translocase subunit SecE
MAGITLQQKGRARFGAGENMAKLNLFGFIQDARSEAAKVTWPSRKETLVTTAMVFVMVIVASVFFLTSDMIIRWLVGLVLGMGR